MAEAEAEDGLQNRAMGRVTYLFLFQAVMHLAKPVSLSPVTSAWPNHTPNAYTRQWRVLAMVGAELSFTKMRQLNICNPRRLRENFRKNRISYADCPIHPRACKRLLQGQARSVRCL